MSVGRVRKHDKHLPRRVYRRHGAFYYVDRAGRWIRLGSTEAEAMRAYAERIADRPAGTLAEAMQRFRAERLPSRAPRTQADYSRSLINLERAFGHMAPAEVEARDVAAYRDARGQGSRVQANHDLAVLSLVFRAAAEWGYCNVNPVREIARFRIRGRERYVTDAELRAWLAFAPALLSTASLFDYLTGLRQGDMLALRKDAITDQGIVVRTSKTGRWGLIAWTPQLRGCVSRILALPRPVTGLHLFTTRHGQPYSGDGFRSIWQRYMRRATDRERAPVLAERFTFQDLRAKHATDAKRQGLNPTDQLLHDDARTTRGYLRTREWVPIQPLAWEAK